MTVAPDRPGARYACDDPVTLGRIGRIMRGAMIRRDAARALAALEAQAAAAAAPADPPAA